MATLAAQPFDLSLDPATTALIVIDMQRDFIEPGGFGAALGNDVTPLQEIVPTVRQLLALARRHGLPVIHTRECHVPELAAIDGELVFDMPGMGAFFATGLGDHLGRLGTRTLIFAGVTTEVCVQTTMREANDRGFDSLLIEDATESYFPAFKTATLEMIRAQGAIVGWTAPLAVLEGALDG